VAQTPIIRKFRGTIEILSTVIDSISNLQLSVEIPSKICSVWQKIATFCPTYFLTHNAAESAYTHKDAACITSWVSALSKENFIKVVAVVEHISCHFILQPLALFHSANSLIIIMYRHQQLLQLYLLIFHELY